VIYWTSVVMPIARGAKPSPGYFAALVIGGMIPSATFFHAARRFINWRALSLTIFMLLLISVFWEATLAVPYGWWGYRQNR
jgi:hypothetical protein